MVRNDTKILYGMLISSKLRSAILTLLYKHSTLSQTEIAKRISQKQQNISKAVHELEKQGLIECLTPEKKAWKHYMITELGKEVIEFGKKLEQEIKKRK